MLYIEQGKDYDDVDETQLPYTHIQNLGHGHSGTVEEVEDRHTNKTYARKTIPIPLMRLSKVERKKVFQNEVDIIRGLGKHRHIVSVFATYVTKRHFGIILHPVASDGDLENFLAEYWNNVHDSDGSDINAQRTNVMTAVIEQGFGCLASGLAFMHEKKVRHKDIKSRNILVHDNRMIYTDFGYSLDSTSLSRSTTYGTPSPFTRKYSAPEVLDYDYRNSRSDVFSLGCVFIEMLSALNTTAPHEDITMFADVIEILHSRIIGWQVPLSLANVLPVVIAMTVREPSKRPCAIHLSMAIFESPGCHCMECESDSLDRFRRVSPEDDCSKLAIMKGRRYIDQSLSKTSRREYAWITQTVGSHTVSDDAPSHDAIKGQSSLPQRPELANAMQLISNQVVPVTNRRQSTPGDTARQKEVDSASTHNMIAPTAPVGFKNDIKVSDTVEDLDPRYQRRYSAEAHEFFVKGRVFAMLWTETAGGSHRSRTATDNSWVTTQIYRHNAISPGRFGQDVYSQIRRFVIVKVNRRQHFVLACAITTYGQRGVLKPNCNAREHTVVYLRGCHAYYIPGEYEKGMTKEPLMIDPTDPTEDMSPKSRLCLGKVVSIECNVKVRDIGMVIPEHRSKLLEYYQQEQDNGFEADEYDIEWPRFTPVSLSSAQEGYGASASASPAQGSYHNPNGYDHNQYPASTLNTQTSYPSSSKYPRPDPQAHSFYPQHQSQPYSYPSYQYRPS